MHRNEKKKLRDWEQKQEDHWASENTLREAEEAKEHVKIKIFNATF